MRVCVLGGGTAGWMTAAALSKKLDKSLYSIHLVESEAIGTVGVGEATLPHIRFFNESLGIDEKQFMRETEATFKLGIEFCDWGRIGQRYVHPFGDFGKAIDGIDFYQHWIKLDQHGEFGRLDEYAYGIVAAKHDKFQLPQHTSIRLDNGEMISADLFIDCSGFRGVLIEQTLASGYQDWSQWLPCNRAIAVPCESTGSITPYTRATALTAGWQWRIPLQHRTGNGHVYWNEFISDDEACSQLLDGLDGSALAEPKQLYFKTGRRNHFWKNNVVAIGLAGGFLEPLESTSIHLIQEGITTLVELLPQTPIMNNLDIDEYNTRMALQYERVRDFLLLHYVANERTDSEMWRYFAAMTLPDSLQEKIDAWLRRGYIQRYEIGAFLPPSWVAVMMGQNLIPKSFDPRVNKSDFNKVQQLSKSMRADIHDSVMQAKTHFDYIREIGAASNTQAIRAS